MLVAQNSKLKSQNHKSKGKTVGVVEFLALSCGFDF
jgi:hypothetical protein